MTLEDAYRDDPEVLAEIARLKPIAAKVITSKNRDEIIWARYQLIGFAALAQYGQTRANLVKEGILDA